MKWWQRFLAFTKNEWGKFRVCCRKSCADCCASCCKKGKRKKKAVVLTEESLRSVRKLFSFETFFDMYQTYKRHEVLVTQHDVQIVAAQNEQSLKEKSVNEALISLREKVESQEQ